MGTLCVLDPLHNHRVVAAKPASSSKRRRHNLAAKIRIPIFKNTRCMGFLCVMCLIALGGCSSLNVKLGRRVDLTKTPVASIELSLPKGPAIAPGQKSPLVVTVTQPDGKVLLTEGQGKGKVQWKDLQITATVVTADKKGNISLSRDPRVSDGKVGHVTVTVPSHPDVHADLDVPFRYDIAFVSNFSGARGQSGNNGLDGISGISGTSGSLDPNNPSPGGDGTNGTDGSDGQDGGPGGNAASVQVMVTLQPGPKTLLEISATTPGHRRLYLVDPQGGSLTVKADGGPGGSGGRGGQGGRGGSGGIGMPNGRDGSNGADGRNGFDGPPGKGSSITVSSDPSTKPYLSAIHLSSKNGPSPSFQQQYVAPLW